MARGPVTVTQVICDQCGHVHTGAADREPSTIHLDRLALTASAGREIDAEEYDFCRLQCFVDWLKARGF